MNYYRMCGMNVAAGLELPGAAPLSGFSAAPDAIVQRGEVPHELQNATRSGPTWQVATSRVLLQVPGVARFLISDGSRIVFEPAPGRSDAELSIFVMGSAMGALLHQRGLLVLHAGAVVVDGKAALFCGHSGAGKSSLVAALCQSGRSFITDDIAVVQFHDGVPFIVPDGRRLKLWADAVERLSLTEYRGPAVREGIEKYWVNPPNPAPQARYPVGEVFFLREIRSQEPTHIERLSSVDTARSLRATAYRPRLPAAMDQEATWFTGCSALTRHIHAYSLTRQVPFDAADECLSMLDAHWRGAGHDLR
ncbi:MAG TPA: hypothetical protein VER03_00610 [Bryobacteraceae bacterium]|nr:hypothetical protein [Bryobacteraceae bacterium]